MRTEYKQIDGKWPEPTKKQFNTYTSGRYATGPYYEDIHWWWRHLPKEKQY